jgi:ABC-type uncharacterized transport system fused permease/ATPase subunit
MKLMLLFTVLCVLLTICFGVYHDAYTLADFFTALKHYEGNFFGFILTVYFMILVIYVFIAPYTIRFRLAY